MNKNLMKPPEKEGKFRNLMNAAFPRVSALNGRVAPWSARAGIASLADLASLPGRAYVSIGRPEGESYMSALGRTEPRYDMASYQGEGDELAESILRDPTLPLGVGLGRLASGLGKVGRVALDALGNAGMTAGSQYATSGQVDPIAVAMAAGLGAAPHAMPGKAPVSRMAPEITPEQRAANFKNWFGDSKVVDEEGNPLVLHHGSTAQFDEFKAGEFGFHLGDESAANMFGDVKKVYLSARNPFRIKRDMGNWRPEDMLNSLKLREYKGPLNKISDEDISAVEKQIKSLRRKHAKDLKQDDDMFLYSKALYDVGAPVRELYKKRGYDAILYNNEGEGGLSYIAFDPTQIKSATGNRGTFDPTDPNITHFAGRSPIARQSTPIQALGNRLSAGAKQAVFRNLMGGSQNRGDTYYTKGGSR